MKKFFLLLILLLIITNSTPSQETNLGVSPSIDSEKFTLITSLYNEICDERISEYITCFKKNMAHKDIENFIVFYDTSKDHLGKLTILSYLENINVPIISITKRPTFQDCFNAANERCPNSRIIICNADIYFNETLSLLMNYNLANKFIALSRWNLQKDNSIKLHNPSNWSQDAWIFKTPIGEIMSNDIELGTAGCDNLIAFRANQRKLKVINPCISVQCIHVHLSKIYHNPKPLLYIALNKQFPSLDNFLLLSPTTLNESL